MAFYFPLRLGVKLQKAADRREDQDGHTKLQAYETWREGTDRTLTDYEESPEAQVLKAFCDSAPAQRLTFILGEPGAGKTTLFLDWFLRLAQGAAKDARVGAKLPILVRLRSVPADMWNTYGEAELADALWKHARTERTILKSTDSSGCSFESLYSVDASQSHVFFPIWLFDGLDEMDPKLSANERFYQVLACLPGLKLVSARIAVYQSLRVFAEGYKWKDYEILGLGQGEQQEFLEQTLQTKGDRAAIAKSKTLIAEIRRNTAVRMLAGNPMMLGFMAELAADGAEPLALPESRAAFYAQSINRLWYRKLAGDNAALAKREERDRFLAERAAAMELRILRARLPALPEDLERGLRKSGLIRANDQDGTFEFLHLTFQEYHLALHLRTSELKTALERHWSDARYEETLGLLVSLLFEEKRYQEIEDGIRWLVNWGAETHNKDPNALWRIGRSPIRTALHILSRAGISLGIGGFEGLLESLWRILVGAGRGPRREVMKLAAARDFRTPPELLGRLAVDEDDEVRFYVAVNASTPPELLGRLAGDEDYGVRMGVALNASTPPELLGRLAGDEHREVRKGVARNASTPPELLGRLAGDEVSKVRIYVAENANTPPELLGRLARDAVVRSVVAANASTPPELLGRLAEDNTFEVRKRVARNASTPLELLGRLAGHWDHEVRQGIAGNASTPPELLGRLAGDEDRFVRWSVAENASTPLELLGRLAEDDDSEVRRGVAANASTPPELLDRLAEDEDSIVRWSLAQNASTPPDLLGRLAGDEDHMVRRSVAGNASMPSVVLGHLAGDEDRGVRFYLAKNANTPPELLGRLAGDEDRFVRQGVARNASTPSEVLGRLAGDEDRDVRWGVAANVRLLLEDLLEESCA